jgi:hypothetical protein
MSDPKQALYILREAEAAAEKYIDHSFACSDCKVQGAHVVMCPVGRLLWEEHMTIGVLAEPYVQEWKQATGQKVTIQ